MNGSVSLNFAGGQALINVGRRLWRPPGAQLLADERTDLQLLGQRLPDAYAGLPGGSETLWGWNTIALPLPPSELVDGADSITLGISNHPNALPIANVDIILVGGSGSPPGGTLMPPDAKPDQ